MEERRVIYTSKPRTVIDKYETEFIAPENWGTFGEFIGARRPKQHSRYSPEEREAKDRRKYGKCPGCQKKHADDDKIYFAQSVYKNGKCLGNLFACEACALAFNGSLKS
jgi:hypothetical protein